MGGKRTARGGNENRTEGVEDIRTKSISPQVHIGMVKQLHNIQLACQKLPKTPVQKKKNNNNLRIA